MMYGSLFYPLFTLGLEQVYRVAEAAARAKAARMSITLVSLKGKHRPFGAVLDDPSARKLSKDEHDVWSKARVLRNLTTHTMQQMHS